MKRYIVVTWRSECSIPEDMITRARNNNPNLIGLWPELRTPKDEEEALFPYRMIFLASERAVVDNFITLNFPTHRHIVSNGTLCPRESRLKYDKLEGKPAWVVQRLQDADLVELPIVEEGDVYYVDATHEGEVRIYFPDHLSIGILEPEVVAVPDQKEPEQVEALVKHILKTQHPDFAGRNIRKL